MSPEEIRGKLNDAMSFLKPEEGTSVPEEIHRFREEFQKLLDEAKVDQLVVLIDDLDRCLPATAIDTLEAIRLFLFAPKTAFVIGADEVMIEYAVREHFPKSIPSFRLWLQLQPRERQQWADIMIVGGLECRDVIFPKVTGGG